MTFTIRRAHTLLWALGCAFLLVVGVVGTAHADGEPVVSITKQLDSAQGAGFSAPNEFMVGALVRYSIEVTCVSSSTDCTGTTVSDYLDRSLHYVEVQDPASAGVSGTANGQSAQIVVGTPDSPFTVGSTVRLVLVARVDYYAGSSLVTNQAMAAAPDGPPAFSEEVGIKVLAPKPTWRLVKSGPTTAAPGDEVSYRLDLESYPLGNLGVMFLSVVDTYPVGAEVVDAGGGTVDEATHTIAWPVVMDTINPASGDCTLSDGWCRPKPYMAGFATVTLRYPRGTFMDGDTVVNKASARVSYLNETGGLLVGEASTLLRVQKPSEAPTPTAVPPLPRTGSSGVDLWPLAGLLALICCGWTQRLVRGS